MSNFPTLFVVGGFRSPGINRLHRRDFTWGGPNDDKLGTNARLQGFRRLEYVGIALRDNCTGELKPPHIPDLDTGFYISRFQGCCQLMLVGAVASLVGENRYFGLIGVPSLFQGFAVQSNGA